MSTCSATEPMMLSLKPLTSEMAALSPNSPTRIPSAAERYYAQPRFGNVPVTASTSEHRTSVNLTGRDDLAEGQRTLKERQEVERDDCGKRTTKKQSRARRPPGSNFVAASSTAAGCHTRRSARLINKRAAALEKVLRERLLGVTSLPTLHAGKKARRLVVDPVCDALPALSEDPTSYNSNPADCRFHLPSSIEDQLAVRAALTPTLFLLQKKSWRGGVVWNPDASYMEAYQICLQAYYKFELWKRPDLSPFDLPSVLALLPWYGKIRDFRSSPNWPKGW
jgi:hypothetical protein